MLRYRWRHLLLGWFFHAFQAFAHECSRLTGPDDGPRSRRDIRGKSETERGGPNPLSHLVPRLRNRNCNQFLSELETQRENRHARAPFLTGPVASTSSTVEFITLHQKRGSDNRSINRANTIAERDDARARPEPVREYVIDEP